MVGYGAVPQTLLRLGVEPVRRPAKVVWRVEGDTDQPRQNHSDDGVTATKHCMIHVVPAHVQVTVNCDDRDGEQRHDTADDTEAGCRCAQPLSSSQQLLFSHHCAFDNTPTCVILISSKSKYSNFVSFYFLTTPLCLCFPDRPFTIFIFPYIRGNIVD